VPHHSSVLLFSPYRKWVVNLLSVVVDRTWQLLLGKHMSFSLTAIPQSPPVFRVDRQSLHNSYRRNTDERAVIRDRSISKQTSNRRQGVIGQRRIDERPLAFEGFCGATAREPISNIRIDKFREGCRKPSSPFRQLICLSACSLDSASGPSGRCYGPEPVCSSRGRPWK